MPHRLSVLLMLGPLLFASVSAQQRPRTDQAPAPSAPPGPSATVSTPRDEPGGQPPSRAEVAASEDKVSTTSHTVRLDGREVKYTATAGTLPIRLDNGRVAARMFFVAYSKDGEEARTRPVSFLYNGGPGSASVWLHMGSFSPLRVQMADDGFQPAPPYRLVENEQSLIDVSDLVFVDAISTGYSRAVAGVDAGQFHGWQGDVRSFGEFVRAYLTAYNRWPSPKFLIGESYGTIRSAGLSRELQDRHGIELNGIVLVSSLLTYQTLLAAPDNDVYYAALVPTYAATAWYHKKLGDDLQQQPVKSVVDRARTFALGEYSGALARGSALSDAERKALAQKLARLTGLSAGFIESANLRVTSDRYRKELLRDKRLTVGRLDSRYTGLDLDAAGEREEFDPSNTALQGAYTALFANYVKHDLRWETDLHYPTSGDVQPWTYPQNRYYDETERLRAAMARNPFLKVFVACGYYDMATPLLGAEFNFSHLAYDTAITSRVSFGYYEGGHMMYVRPVAHRALKQDVAAFIRGAAGVTPAPPQP